MVDLYTKTKTDELLGAKYAKPASGIPTGDLASTVQASLSNADTAVQPAGLTKAAVGLGSVDNTADADKPISAAQQAALDEKLSTVDLSTVPPGYLHSIQQNSDGTWPAAGSSRTDIRYMWISRPGNTMAVTSPVAGAVNLYEFLASA